MPIADSCTATKQRPYSIVPIAPAIRTPRSAVKKSFWCQSLFCFANCCCRGDIARRRINQARALQLNLPPLTTKQVCKRPPLPQEERQASSSRSQLQRLDSDLAELDHALAELQRHWSFGMRAAADARGLLAVEHDGKVAALGRNLHGAPLATGLRHRVDLGVIDDSAGAVARVGPRVEDVALVAGLGAGFLGVLAADEDATVGIVADPELGVDLEVFVFVLRDQEGGVLRPASY